MSRFSNLKRYEPKTNLVWYKTPHLMGDVMFGVLPAIESNKPYFNAALKRNMELSRGRKIKIDAGMIEATRVEDKKLFAKYVVKDWKNVKDDTGADVPFSPEVCEEFFDALPAYIFDDIRAFCVDPANFIEPVDLEDIAKN